jgi:hypothetical protein
MSASGLPPLRIGLPGMGASSAATIALAIERFGNGEFELVDVANADALVMDVDQLAFGPDSGVLPHRQPRLLLSLRELPAGDALTLRKPLSVSGLLGALRQLRQRALAADSLPAAAPSAPAPVVAAQPAAAVPPAQRDLRVGFMAPGDEPAAVAGAAGGTSRFDPDGGLPGLLRRAAALARRKERVVSIMGLATPAYVCPRPDTVVVVADVEALLGRPAEPMAVAQCVPLAALPIAARRQRTLPLEDLLWNATLATSAGRLPVGVDPQHRYRLTAWPNFPRLRVPPQALRIVALWTAQALSPGQVAQRLKIDERAVNDVFSAAWTSGLVQAVSPALAPPPERAARPAAQEPPPRSLLRRLLDKLRLGR